MPTAALAAKKARSRVRPTSTPRAAAPSSPSASRLSRPARATSSSAGTTNASAAPVSRGIASYPRAPASQRDTACIWSGRSTASTESTSAEAKELKTTPTSSARAGSSWPRARPSVKTSSAAAIAPATAANCAGRTPTNDAAELAATPSAVPEATVTRAVPMAAPPERPKTKGSARGLRKSACRATPATESAAPTSAARMTRGTRSRKSTVASGSRPARASRSESAPAPVERPTIADMATAGMRTATAAPRARPPSASSPERGGEVGERLREARSGMQERGRSERGHAGLLQSGDGRAAGRSVDTTEHDRFGRRAHRGLGAEPDEGQRIVSRGILASRVGEQLSGESAGTGDHQRIQSEDEQGAGPLASRCGLPRLLPGALEVRVQREPSLRHAEEARDGRDGGLDVPHGGEGKRLHRDAEPRQRLHRAPVLRRGLRQDEIRLHRQDRFGLRIVVAPDPGKVALARVVVEARDAGEALSGAEGEHDLRQRRGHRHHPPDRIRHGRAQVLPRASGQKRD